MPAPVQVLVRLSSSRRRWAKSMIRLIDMITISDAKCRMRTPARAYLPIFPEDNAPLLAALLLVKDQLTAVVSPERGP